MLGLSLTYVTGNQINTVNMSQYKVVYVPSDALETSGVSRTTTLPD